MRHQRKLRTHLNDENLLQGGTKIIDHYTPTLLIVSKNDTVVSPKQSKTIAKKLKRAKKPVQIVTLKGEDHWLSKSENRLSMLKAIDEFLKEHNPI